ncbi:MAG: hypothetical protein K6E93_05405 [Bacteroidales bacterium]|nr:hypothetical protein [Bacteroidales bacterium]
MRRCVVAVLFAVLMASCGIGGRNRVYDPGTVRFEAAYNTLFDNILYPSMLLAVANQEVSERMGLFSVSLTSPADHAVLRVVIDSSQLNYVTILQEEMPHKGERYTFVPQVKWKFGKLYNLRQQGTVDLTFTCYINDEEVDVKNLRLNYRSVNECPLSVRDTAGHNHDFRWLFMAYVNEDHPYIDSILTTVLAQGNVSTFSGYQKGSQHVVDQVAAIWYYALDRGITYSSISCTSNPSSRATTQHIRFFDEVYNSRQANCIDACVFFASIMRKIGLKPVVLVEPCHAYLGYYTDKNKRHLSLLETTITSWVNMPAMKKTLEKNGRLSGEQYEKLKKYLTPAQLRRWNEGNMDFEELEHALAQYLFVQATTYPKAQYDSNLVYFNDTNQLGYQMLQVDELRKSVQPISAQ